jgi:uncharacterized protein YciI
VNRAIEKLTVKLGHSPTVAELAAHLGATEEDILEAQELGQAYNLLSLDTELNGEGDKKSQTLADYVGHNDPALEMLEDRANLERAFGVLSGRERVILYLRFYESVSQTEIAEAPQRLADARLAPAAEGARKAAARTPLSKADGERIMTAREAQSHNREVLLAAHERYIEQLREQGKLSAAGKVAPPDALLDLVVFRPIPLEDAQRLLGDDPAIRAGVIRAEYHHWWSADHVLPW